MVTRTEQARWHGDRWFGGATSIALAASATRLIHPEEARTYYVTLTSSAGSATLTLPYDVRNWSIGGPYFTIFIPTDAARSTTVNLKTVDGATVQAMGDGFHYQVYLLSNASAVGTWGVTTTTAASVVGRALLS
jgi:hypothetical protein